MNEEQKEYFYQPSREEVKAMNHFWAAAMANVKRAKNRAERREEKKHGKEKQ